MATSTTMRRELVAHHRALDRVSFDRSNNHAPMVLSAMERLGATDAQMVDYFDGLSRADAVDDHHARGAPFDGSAWHASLGRWERVSDFIEHFDRDVAERGRDVVLREALPVLMPGVGAHAFHPMLRLGYALECDDDREVAASLGYWAASFLPGPHVSQASPASPRAILDDMLASPKLSDVEPVGHNIAVRMARFFDHPSFAARAAPVACDPRDPLAELAPLVVRAFADTQHFTLLHGITSLHALRMVLPFIDDVERSVTHYTHALIAAVLTVTNAPKIPPVALPEEDTGWDEIKRGALASNDEHTIKLVDSCRQEHRRTADDTYRLIALREVRGAAQFS